MNTKPRLPYLDLEQTVRFYTRLGFSIRRENNYVVAEMAEVELHFFHEKSLVPMKNAHLGKVSVDEISQYAQEFSEKFVPEESDCSGWLVPHKNGELDIVDPNGNLVMFRRRRAA